MATATQSSPAPNFKIVSKLDGVPVIHDSVTYADSLLNSTETTASLYRFALGLANKSYGYAEPIVNRSKPLIDSADGLAVAVFDRAEATFPYPFKTPTGDLVVVKQSKAVYDSRIAPLLQQYQPVVNDVLDKTAKINGALGARAHATFGTSKEYADHLLEQLKQLAAQGKVLPGHLIEGAQKASNDIKEIVLAKDATLQEKSNKLGAYVLDQVKPVVDEIYNYVLGAKKKAEEQAGDLQKTVEGQVNGVTDKAKKQADETVDKVHGAPQ